MVINVVPLQTILYFCFDSLISHQSALENGDGPMSPNNPNHDIDTRADGVPASLPGNRQGTISQSVGRTCYLSLLLSPKEDLMHDDNTNQKDLYVSAYVLVRMTLKLQTASYSILRRRRVRSFEKADRRQTIRLFFNEPLCCVCGLWHIPYIYVARPYIET